MPAAVEVAAAATEAAAEAAAVTAIATAAAFGEEATVIVLPHLEQIHQAKQFA